MADVQLEHGHIRIANRLLEALLEAGITGAQLRIMVALLRLTYGWRRKTVRISVPELAAYVRLSPVGGFRRALRELVHEGVVLAVDEGGGSVRTAYTIQKDFTRWGRFSVAEERLARVWDERPSSDDRLLKRPVTPTPEGHTHIEGGDPTGSDGVTPQGNTVLPHRDGGAGDNSPPPQDLEGRKDREIQERHDTDTARARADAANQYAIGLATAANNAITERWGEQTRPLRWDTACQLATELIAIGVPLDLARTAVATTCRTSKNPEPPKSIVYFTNPITDAFAAAKQRELDRLHPAPKGPTKPTRISVTPAGAVESSADRTRRERELRIAYDAEKREAGIAWGKDAANEKRYRELVAEANEHYAAMIEQPWAQRARDAMVITRCAEAAGFPSFESWSGGRAAPAGAP